MQNINSTSGTSQKSFAIRLVTYALILVLIGAIVSSLNFTSVSATESYSLIRQWGSRGTGNGQFNFPYSLALDSSKNVYVNDLNNQRIQKFDTNGNFITMWSTGPFNHATGIATDSSNNVYVYHVYNEVIKYTSNGTLIKSWAVNSNPNPKDNDVQPAIAVDSGNNVYASNNNTIFKFTSDGTFIRSWGSGGSSDGQFNQIVGIATDSSNNVYVTDKYNGRVEKFTSDGGFIKTWGENCQGERVFCSEPQGIATDSSNNVYVTEYNAGRVSKFTSDGNFITGWDAPSAYGVAVDPLGKVYISSGFDNIQIYAPSSTTIHRTTLELNTISNVPSGTTVTVTGKLTDNAGGAGVAGKTITFTGTGAGNLASVTTSPDGTFTASGSAPSTVAAGWTVQAHFAGDSLYGAADSSVQSFNTVRSTPIPPDTTITSAVESNGSTITNGSTTLSSSIRFTFTATTGTNPVASFECSLDNSAFSSCSSPATLTNLAAGKHTFQVRAEDTAGNKDPTPATFSWTISSVTPTQSIQQLIQLKHSMHLNPATDQTLDIRLNIALQFAQNNVKSGTCVQLTVFNKLVQGELQVGQVSSVQAAQLIQAAQNIQMALGCTVVSSANGIGPLSASQSPPPSLNLTHSQQKQPQTTASSPSLLQPQSLSPYPYSNQYRYPSQYPQSHLTQGQQLPPIANAGVSQAVNENTRVTLDGRASYSPTGGLVSYQWTQLATAGAPVLLTGANTANPTFTTPIVPSDTVLAFSLRVLDNHGSFSTNPSVVYVSVMHNANNIGTTGGNTPGTAVIPPQQHQQPIVPNNNEINPHSQQQSPRMPNQPTVK